MPPDAWLGDAPHLDALHEPTPRLDLAPLHILQQARALGWGSRLRRGAGAGAAAALVHVGFAAAFFYLLSFRDAETPREIETPVEVVTEAPTPPARGSEASQPEAPRPEAPKPPEAERLKQALAPPVAPDPKPPAPPDVQPLTPPTPPTAEAQALEPPKLVAPPPEPTRAATQERENKTANAAPEQDKVDQAIHEAKPVMAPRTLTTSDPRAGFAVPAPVPPQPSPVEKPAPAIPAKAPSATEQLAAALPMDLGAMPSSFRAVLSGNGAQVSAAYKGLVYGRFSAHPEIGERARRQHLKGQVIVAFSIDGTGKISQLSVLQSSGNAAVDALGLALIRSAGPFPPPPPDAQRSFTPALAFGE